MKKLLSLSVILVLLLGIIPLRSFAATEGNIPSGYIGIFDYDDLVNIKNNLSGKYILMNDIDVSNCYETWDPIDTGCNGFSGIFDGNNHSIIGLNITYNKSVKKDIGLFSVNLGTIKNLKIANCNANIVLYGKSNYGTICATNKGTIDKCKIYGTFTVVALEKFNDTIGIITGTNLKTITKCTTYGKADFSINYSGDYSFGGDDTRFGGIAGNNGKNALIYNCANYCSMNGTMIYKYPMYIGMLFGGISGCNFGNVKNCYNTGDISVIQKTYADSYSTFLHLGGIIGINDSSSSTSNCYNCGNILVESIGNLNVSYVGGVIGRSDSNVSNIYNIGEVKYIGVHYTWGGYNGQTGDLCGSLYGTLESSFCIGTPTVGTGNGNCKLLTKEEFANQNSFTNFDFENTWLIDISTGIERPQLIDNPEHIHYYDSIVSKPTCTTQGYTTHTCQGCNDSYTDSYVPAKGHTDGEWKITKQATFTEEGERTLYCKDCGAVLKTEKIAKLTGKVYSVDISDISMDYKASKTITPSIQIDNGVGYEVKYQSSNSKVATVDDNGKVYAKGTGNATITCTVTDSYGNVVSDTCNVKVSYTWWQWIIVILLFGSIWY